jgi:hypothetical protein
VLAQSCQDRDPGQSCAWADFNGDGVLECLRARITPAVASQVFLYGNGGSEGFQLVNGGSLTAGQGLKFAWGDFDNDGYLDVFSGGIFSPYELHRNVGGEDFVDVAATAGLDPMSQNWSQSGCWGDFDNDGDLDLFVANYQKTNTLYQNNGDGTFVSVDAGSPLLDGNKILMLLGSTMTTMAFLTCSWPAETRMRSPTTCIGTTCPTKGM